MFFQAAIFCLYVFSYLCYFFIYMSLRELVPSVHIFPLSVCPFCAYPLGVNVFLMCMSLPLYIAPCVWLFVCMSPHANISFFRAYVFFMHMSPHMYVTPCVCRSVCISPHAYVPSYVCSMCMFSRVFGPSVQMFHLYTCLSVGIVVEWMSPRPGLGLDRRDRER